MHTFSNQYIVQTCLNLNLLKDIFVINKKKNINNKINAQSRRPEVIRVKKKERKKKNPTKTEVEEACIFVFKVYKQILV